mgnify:CR=1 FL=1
MKLTPEERKNNLVWIDMEMSGLNFETEVILEVATIVTDKDLNIIAEGPELTISQEPELFDKMDDWNQSHHSKSGLWEKVLKSETTVRESEQATLNFIKEYTNVNTSPLCGNSIAQDRLFIMKFMPELNNYLHYRMIDVSTIKELGSRWYPDELKVPKKSNKHRALDDIRESIEELKYYRNFLFKDKI